MPPMAPSRVAGGLAHSSSSSGIFFQGDGQSQAVINSHLSSSFGNSSNSIQGTGRPNLGPASGDVTQAVLNSVANSAPSVGASSLVTDANSALSGGPHLQRSASINMETYMRLPASPMSFSSNNVSMDGSSVVQQNTNQDHSSQQAHQQQQGASTASSLPTPQTGQVSLPRVASCFIQEPNNLTQVPKKPRLDIKQEDILQQQVIQQLLQRQDPLDGHSPQLQALIQQQRLRLQQQQVLQSMPQMQRAHLQQQQQMQLRHHLQHQGMQQMPPVRRPYDGGVCARRLMQYLYHQRQRPADNSIAYWRKFVAEYYAPRAKKRWCLSLYDNVGHQALGVFPPAAMDVWHCDICGSKSGRGFEATFEVLPRLNEIKFGSGVIDELLFLDFPREIRFPSGIMALEYGKAVQESVYEQLRVIREGQLRIIFAPDLKIFLWEFCARRHEEFLPRRVIAHHVNQLVQVAQKCQSSIVENGSEGISVQELQTNSNMVHAAGRQLARSLELQSLNDLGFSKRYVRCLQISEVVNSMKDLIDYCRETKSGPIDGLKSYPGHAKSKLQMQKMQEMEQIAGVQGLPSDRNAINKLMALHPGLGSNMNNNSHILSRGGLSGSAQAALALTSYQSLLMQQNSLTSNTNSLQQEASSSFNNSNQSPSSTFQGSAALVPGNMQNFPAGGLTPRLQHSRSFNTSSILQQNQPQPSQSQGSQVLPPHMIQQLLQDMGNNGGVQQQSLSGQDANTSLTRNGAGFGNNAPGSVASSAGMPGNGVGSTTMPSNSFKMASNSESSAAGGNSAFNQRATDVPQNLQLSDEMVQDIAQEFTDNGFFNGELENTMGYSSWRA